MAFSERGGRRRDSFPVQVLVDGQNDILKRVNDRELTEKGALPGDVALRRRTLLALELLRQVPSQRVSSEDWFRLYGTAEPKKITAPQLWISEILKASKVGRYPSSLEAQHYWAMSVFTDATYRLKVEGFISPAKYDTFCAEVDKTKAKVSSTVAFECLPPKMAQDRVDEIETPLHDMIDLFIHPNSGDQNAKH